MTRHLSLTLSISFTYTKVLLLGFQYTDYDNYEFEIYCSTSVGRKTADLAITALE